MQGKVRPLGKTRHQCKANPRQSNARKDKAPMQRQGNDPRQEKERLTKARHLGKAFSQCKAHRQGKVPRLGRAKHLGEKRQG
jgi:hypothetical protein